MSRSTAPQVSFADWELMHQRSMLNPLLAAIFDLLDQEEEVIQGVRLDVERGLKCPAMCRGGLTPAQVLRSYPQHFAGGYGARRHPVGPALGRNRSSGGRLVP